MPKGRTFFASVTGTVPVKIRFMSAQRGKKTRSAASRYLRLRLGFVACYASVPRCGRLQKAPSSEPLSLCRHAPYAQPPLSVNQVPLKKRKRRHAKRETRAVGRSVSTHTASPHYLRLRLGSGAACSACALVVTDDSKKLRRPHRLALRQARCPYSQPPLAVSINVPCEKRVHHG